MHRKAWLFAFTWKAFKNISCDDNDSDGDDPDNSWATSFKFSAFKEI